MEKKKRSVSSGVELTKSRPRLFPGAKKERNAIMLDTVRTCSHKTFRFGALMLSVAQRT